MIINWYGEGCFKIQTEGAVILTDVFESKIGPTPPRLKPDILLKTIAALPPSGEFSEEQEAETRVIDCPGEYEVSGIYIEGLPLSGESTQEFSKTVYVVESEGLRLCFLGHLSEMPDPAIMEKIEEIDLLLFPPAASRFYLRSPPPSLSARLNRKSRCRVFIKFPALKGLRFPQGFSQRSGGGERRKRKTVRQKERSGRKDENRGAESLKFEAQNLN